MDTINNEKKIAEIIKDNGFYIEDFDEAQLKIISIAVEKQIGIQYINKLVNPQIGAFFMKSAIDDILIENINPIDYLYSNVTLKEYCVLREKLFDR